MMRAALHVTLHVALLRALLVTLPAVWAGSPARGAAHGAGAASPQVLTYLARPGPQPGRGQLLALALPATAPAAPLRLPAPTWEAGARLAVRDPDSRRLLTARAGADGTVAAHLARLRRAPLARSPDGARPVLVPPPAWLPGRPGHAAFAAAHAARASLVWLGTRDGLLHAFDATSGEEVLAYLPGVAAGHAGDKPDTRKPAAQDAARGSAGLSNGAPCPYPEAADVQLGPARWRTVLLCGVAAAGAPAAVFALDITDAASAPPAGPLWETAASAALPLAPAGPVRALALPAPGGPRWQALVPLATGGLALLPLDKPVDAPWQGQYAARRLRLPASGCGASTAGTALRAATVLSDAAGLATAAYAVDDAGRLWRFGLRGPAPWLAEGRCLHGPGAAARQSGAVGVAAAPEVFSAAGGHLVVYGSGSHVVAIPDPPAPPAPASAGDRAGWRLPLASPGERLERLLPASPGHVALLTRTPDARQRAYLVRALDGTPASAGDAAGDAGEETRNKPPEAAAGATLILARAPLVHGTPPRPGLPARQTTALTLWSLDAGYATPLGGTVASRRTGRLRWRELIRAGVP
ncbi:MULTISPECIES: hypothetical protein [Cupriavidus]